MGDQSPGETDATDLNTDALMHLLCSVRHPASEPDGGRRVTAVHQTHLLNPGSPQRKGQRSRQVPQRLNGFLGAAVTSGFYTTTLHNFTAQFVFLGRVVGPDRLIGTCSNGSAILRSWQERMHGHVHDQHDQRRKNRSRHIITTHF